MPKRTSRIIVHFTAVVFGIFSVTMSVVSGIALAIYGRQFLEGQKPLFLITALTSVVVGTWISKIAGKRLFYRIDQFNEATKEVANGNYKVRLIADTRATEINEIIKNFNIMVDQLSSTELLRTDFIENVSHEFKTPLAAIEGYAMLLQRVDLTDQQKSEFIQKIVYNTKRLSSLTGNILLLSRIENQDIGIIKEQYDLSEDIREVIVSLEPQWSTKNISLDIDIDEIQILANRELLQHVWTNILGNAIKYNKDNGSIKVSVKQDKGVAIIIEDSGIGMSPKVLERVFEKFYQGDTSRTNSGNGLGMTLVKRILTLHNGSIEVTSEENVGTKCIIKL